MTGSTPPLSYAGGPVGGTCPLCRRRPVWRKRIYGHSVCKKCYYAFANRRQLGYLVDALVFLLPVGIAIGVAELYTRRSGVDEPLVAVIGYAVGLAAACLFVMKDGFGGQSPGKRLMGVQALDDVTGQPIGFGRSFKRNSVILVGQVPVVGGIVGGVVVIVIALQVARGYRLGDKFAKTRVIWKKYARLAVFGGDALVCEGCGYDLQGNVSGVCPECGMAVSEANARRLAAVAAVPPAPVNLG